MSDSRDRLRLWLARNAGVIISSMIGGAAIVVAAIVGTDAKHDRDLHERQKKELSVQLDAKDAEVRRLAGKVKELNEQLTREPRQPNTLVTQPQSIDALTSSPSPVEDVPIVTALARDILITIRTCAIQVRSLRCTVVIENQGKTERKFVLAVGGARTARFDNPGYTSWYFDDLGNEDVSAGGAVGNRELTSCNGDYPCKIEKILVPNVPTAAWVRFDGVEPNATAAKLIRIGWRDDTGSESADFRHIALQR